MIRHAPKVYASPVEWTPARIRLFRDVGLCQSQEGFAKTLGFAERTIGNAERGTHRPNLALRRALNQALEHASAAQRDRFLAADRRSRNRHASTPSIDRGPLGSHTSQVGAAYSSSAVAPDPTSRALHGLRSAVLGTPLPVSMSVSDPVTHSAASVTAAIVQAHRRYQLAEYDAAAQLLPAVLTCLSSRVDTGSDECLADVPTTRHATAAAYLATAKIATKLGNIVLASVAADRAMTAAKESEHPTLIGSATYQAACALLLTGELADAEQILTLGVENIASVAATPRLNCHQEEALSVRGSLLLLLAIIAARRSDPNAAQDVLQKASQLAEQLGCDGNWLWTAFGPTNVAIHQLSVQSRLGDAKKAAQIAESIDTNALPAVLRGRRSQVHLEMAWATAEQADDALAVLHLLEVERVAEQAVSRNISARTLISTLLARERRGDTPGLRGLAARAGLLS
jgi:DNA-binding XRE family transcriptional regulator